MGFWHTGYLDMLGLGPPGVLPLSREGSWTPTYRCPTCTSEFETADRLRAHQFRGHIVPAPALYFRGVECHRRELEISDIPVPDDWYFAEATSAVLNGEAIPPETLGVRLASNRKGVADVQLELDGVVRDYVFRFAVASPEDLDGVDVLLRELAGLGRLDLESIDWFIRRGRAFPSASRYVDGLAKYLFGALNRDRSDESGLEPGEYRDRYSQAAHQLRGFDRTPARIVRGLVSFHYNQFDDVKPDVGSDRLYRAADRLRACLAGTSPEPGPIGRQGVTELDTLLSDADTERMLRWVGLPLGEAHEQVLEEMDEFQKGCDPFDRLKLQLVLAEHDIQLGRLDSARARAHSLRHTPDAADWASAVLQRTSGSQGA